MSAEAIGDYRRCLEIDPENAQACNNLGVEYTNNGEFDLAMESYSRAIEKKPDFVEAFNNRGVCSTGPGNTTMLSPISPSP